MLDRVVTASEMAAILNVSTQHIRKKCAKGEFECRKSSDGVWLILIQPKEANQ